MWEASPFNLDAILIKILSTATDLFHSLPSKLTSTPRPIRHIGWTHPPSGFFKLNSDGSAHGNPGCACAVAIIRDSHGAWISSCSRKIGHAYSLAVESRGLHDGLMLAKNLNIHKLVIEVDASTVANFFSNTNTSVDSSHPYSALIIDCRYLLQHFEDAHVNHVHREGNHCADILAKEGINSLSDFVIHPAPLPIFCTNLWLTFGVLFTLDVVFCLSL